MEKAAQYLLLPSHSLDANVLLNATSMAAGQWNSVLRGPPPPRCLLSPPPPCHSSDPLALLVLEYLDVGATTACSSCRGLGGI